MMKAHRAGWQILGGQLSAGEMICHSCDNPACVRPSHWFKGTAIDNNRDRHVKGRSKALFARGHKLNQGSPVDMRKAVKAIAIRKMLAEGIKQEEIAKRFGVHSSQISRVKTGRFWSHA